MAPDYSSMKRKKLKKAIISLEEVTTAAEKKLGTAEQAVETARVKLDKQLRKLSKFQAKRDTALTALVQAKQALAELNATKKRAAVKSASAENKPTAKQPATDNATDHKTGSSTRNTATDDLTIIHGIGPKLASVLNEKGITSWAQLARRKPKGLRKILTDAGLSDRVHNPESWPAQAALAKKGQFDDLKAMKATTRTNAITD